MTLQILKSYYHPPDKYLDKLGVSSFAYFGHTVCVLLLRNKNNNSYQIFNGLQLTINLLLG